jgi:hypothetical protein
MADTDKKQSKRAQYLHEYNRRDYVMETKRAQSLAFAHKKKVMTTKKRFEELSMDDLLYIARLKCTEAGLDFEAQKPMLEAALRILHGPEII